MSRKSDLAILIIALLFPSLITWLYFVQFSESDVQPNTLAQAIYAIGKLLQFGFPVAFVWWMDREALGWSAPKRRGVVLGIGFGLIVLALVWAIYQMWLKPAGLLGDAALLARQKLSEFRLNTPLGFIILGAFYALVHAFLEEYYWRWFVFGRLQTHISWPFAALVSSLGFMAHHVILLSAYFPDHFWTLAVPFSLCIALGGAVWSWLYTMDGNLTGPWLSHLIVDAAIFIIGYDLVFGG